MSRKKGYLLKCDRCGNEAFFESQERIEDSNWNVAFGYKDLCPDCSAQYRQLIDDFFGNEMLEKQDPEKCQCYSDGRCLGTKEMDLCKGEKCKQWKEK